ncbi:MAG: shikimate dehydrogenase [Anaerolineae bacterium]|nr:shikimate dehydrogenase [Anaerolineae bacterium]
MATQYPIVTKTVPTFYFVGVTTNQSSIMKVFPRWMGALGRPDVVIEGIDHLIHDAPEAYRATVAQIKYDPLSLGGLVTTHKIDLLEAARDMFDVIDSSSALLGEASCISKRDGKLVAHAKDPLTSGLSLDAILVENYFGRTGGHVLCFGAGGSGKAMALHWINKPNAGDRPERMVVVNRSQGRLDQLQAMVERLETDIAFEYIQNADPVRNDAIMARMPEYSIVINATGMGKDTPGSPVTDAGLFPKYGIAWEINYRGELDFWHQAMAQRGSRNVTVEDGWLYFVHGWTQVIAEVLHIDIDQETFDRLEAIAEELRPPLELKPRGA